MEMNLKRNKSKRRKSEIIEQYFRFPVETVECFDLGDAEHLENPIKAHKKLLGWWLNGYLPSYIKHLTKIVAAHPKKPAEWITSWQQAAARCGCLVNDLPDFLLILAQPTQIPMAKERMEKATVSKKATKKLRKAKTGSTSLSRKRMTRNMENQTLKSRKRTWRTT